MDFRYDDFLLDLQPDGDANLFDDQGVTGMHAIERILYASEIRQAVLIHEQPLDGYQAAAFRRPTMRRWRSRTCWPSGWSTTPSCCMTAGSRP